MGCYCNLRSAFLTLISLILRKKDAEIGGDVNSFRRKFEKSFPFFSESGGVAVDDSFEVVRSGPKNAQDNMLMKGLRMEFLARAWSTLALSKIVRRLRRPRGSSFLGSYPHGVVAAFSIGATALWPTRLESSTERVEQVLTRPKVLRR
jgi:hypothetical protein